MQGASAIQNELRQIPQPEIRIFVVWEPVLLTDWTAPTTSVLSRLYDRRAAQFWDRRLLFSGNIQQAVRLDSNHPLASVCDEGETVWDIVAVYGKVTRWEGSFPKPAFADGPVVNVLEGFRKSVSNALAE